MLNETDGEVETIKKVADRCTLVACARVAPPQGGGGCVGGEAQAQRDRSAGWPESVGGPVGGRGEVGRGSLGYRRIFQSKYYAI